MYLPIDDTHPESSAFSTSSFSRAPMNGFEIGIKLSDIVDLLDQSNERFEALPLSFLRIASRYHFMARTGDAHSFIGSLKISLDLLYCLLRRIICRDRLAVPH